MTVYIEYVIIDNVIIDYLMLKATFALTGIPSRKCRLFLCAFLGAVIALIYPALEFSGIILTAIKIFSGLLIVLLANNYKSAKSFYINSLIFFFLTFLTGGAIIGIFNILNIPLSTEISVATVIFPVYIIIKIFNSIIKYFFQRKNIVSFTYKVELFLANSKIQASGFLDTGNSVFYGDSPVIFCNKQFVKKFLAEQIIKIKFQKINIQTANENRQNLCFKLDKFILYIDEKQHIFNNVTVCIAKITHADYDIILHPALFKEMENYEDNGLTKKVC